MLNNPINLQISASTVAWYGAIVATLSACVAIYNAWRDRAMIVITYQKRMKIMNAIPPLSEDKHYFIVTIRNRGRRAVSIGNAGIMYISGEYFLLGDSIHNIANTNRVLTEEKPDTQIISEQEGVDFSKLYYIQVFDKAGREYRKYTSKIPTFKKWWYKIKIIFTK